MHVLSAETGKIIETIQLTSIINLQTRTTIMKKSFLFVGIAAAMMSFASCGGGEKADQIEKSAEEQTEESTEAEDNKEDANAEENSTEEAVETEAEEPSVDMSDVEDAANDIYEKSQKKARDIYEESQKKAEEIYDASEKKAQEIMEESQRKAEEMMSKYM